MEQAAAILDEVDRLRYINCASCVTSDPSSWKDQQPQQHTCVCFDIRTAVLVFFGDAIRHLRIANEDGLEELVVEEALRRRNAAQH